MYCIVDITCRVVQLIYSALILLYYLCIGSNESVSLGGSREAPKSYINDCSTEIYSGPKLRGVSLFTSMDILSVCLSADYFMVAD